MRKLALLLPLLAVGAAPRAGFKLESLLDQDALLFAEIPSARDFRVTFKKTPLYRFFQDEEIRAFAGEALEGAVKGFGDLTRELEKEVGVSWGGLWELADGQIALGMPTLMRGDPDQPDLVLTLDCTGKRDTLRKGIALLKRHYEAHHKEKAEVWKIGDDEIVSGRLNADLSWNVAVLDDTLVLATWKGTMLDIVTSFRKGQPRPLARSAALLQARGKAGAKELFLYANVPGFLKQAEEKLGEQERNWVKALGLEGFTYAAGGLEIRDGSVKERFFLAASGKKTGLAKFLSLKGAAPGFETAPEQALVFTSFSIDSIELYDTLLEMVKNADAFEHQRLLDQIDQFERDAGFSLRKDLLPALGSRVSSYSALPREGLFPDSVTTFELKDAARFDRCVKALRKNLGAELAAIDFNGKKIEYFKFVQPGGFEPVRILLSALYFVRDGDRLHVSGAGLGLGGAGSPNALKRHLLRAGRRTLAEAPAVKAWLAGKTGGASLVVYTDIGRLVSVYYNTLAPFLPPFRSMVRSLGVQADLMKLPLGETFGKYLGQAIHRVEIRPDGLQIDGISASGTTLTTVIYAGAASIVLLPAILKMREDAKSSACMSQCTGVFFAVMSYRSQKRKYPEKTGDAFVKDLVDQGLLAEDPVCPHSGKAAYRGPAKDVNTMNPNDVIFCDEPGNHPDRSISVLRKNGRMERLDPSHPDYRKALETTKGK